MASVRNLLSVMQVCEILGVKTKQVVYRAVKHGVVTPDGVVKLAAVSTRKAMKFCEADVAEYLSAISDAKQGKGRTRTAIDPPLVRLTLSPVAAVFPESRRPKPRRHAAVGGVGGGAGGGSVNGLAPRVQ